ncbi:MAG: toll/interleukin-1 receptor domain-containing protein, partial [Clostridia bacterium]|nr:toll/interleukin-1 receptor domain-containing protein [Clostridia bacterium]
MKKSSIFISYRREGGEFTAKILNDRLTSLGYSVFFDLETLRSGDFNTDLYQAIDACDDFLIILSPNALDRCQNE